MRPGCEGLAVGPHSQDMTNVTKRKALALIRNGATRRAVERETGLSTETVRKLFSEVEIGSAPMTLISTAAAEIRKRSDASYVQIAREIGCSHATVAQAAAKIGMPKRRLTKAQSKEFADRYAMGLSDVDIARACGKDPSSAYKWRKKHNLPPNKGPSRSATKQQRKRAVALVASGCSYREAAAKLGMTRNAVAGAVDRAKGS